MLPKTNMKACFRLLQLMSSLGSESVTPAWVGLGLGLVTADANAVANHKQMQRPAMCCVAIAPQSLPVARLQVEFVFPTFHAVLPRCASKLVMHVYIYRILRA